MPITPPVAAKRPQKLTAHGHTRVDDYYWLRDDSRTAPAVLAYLKAENDYAATAMAHTQDRQQALYEELKARIKQDDESVPVKLGEYFYATRYSKGQEHQTYLRRTHPAAEPEVILDVNELAAAYEFYNVSGSTVSPDGRYLAYSEDTVGRDERVIRIKDLQGGVTLPDQISMTSGDMEWANDNATLLYVKLQAETLIPFQVWRHSLGTDVNTDVLVYAEPDNTFVVGIEKSRDDQWILIASIQTLTTEFQAVPADNPALAPTLFLPRAVGHDYLVEFIGADAFIRTNWNADNFRLMQVPLAHAADRGQWREVIPYRQDTFLEDFQVFDDYIAVEERCDGLLKLRIIERGSDANYYVPASEEVYVPALGTNPDISSRVLRYGYESLATPHSVFELDMESKQTRLLKQDEVIGYDPTGYITRRIHATAQDGASIPVTLLFKAGLEPDSNHPLYILGYGSYGISYDPSFDEDRLSLVNRGFVFAIAHIRGGQELGRHWYEDGKLLAKKNTFTDFIDVAQYLVAEGWGSADKVVGMGRSAGGLLAGAIANMAPEIFTVIVTEVPFVDVVTTMLDETIPLTTFEWDEWGNPAEKQYYDYMLSYSPYDQVEAQDYPHLLVSTGLWDPAVQYWEPAKWVAKLRTTKTNDNRLLFFTDMDAGHSGQPGRFESLKETAREYAFIFDTLGVD
jgi:oligopeptidase B